jgi:hypothetical protein
MSTQLTVVNNGEVYNGYDTAADVQYCTPTYLKCNACITATANADKSVTITISFNTPLGSISKSFVIKNNTSFTWQPYSRFKIELKIGNFSDDGKTFSFDLTATVCIQVLVWSCKSFTHHFSKSSVAISDNLDDYQFATLLAVHGLLNENGCNCH